MTRPHPRGVQAVSMRVALATTAIVAALYAVIAVVVVVISTRNLTAGVDSRLAGSLERLAHGRVQFVAGGPAAPAGGPRFGPPLLIWTVHSDGEVTGNDTTAGLPDDYHSVDGPRTVSIGGTDVRVAGVTIGADRLVVGQSMEGVAQARSNVVLAELLVGPLLLVVVFFGALAIGRRAASPFELARRRQMEFTADASHELRTPLSVIEAQTSLALAQERENGWYRKAFQRVEVESKRIRTLVEDLLWLARFDATRGQPHAEHVDVGVLAQHAAERFSAVAEARSLALRVSVSGENPVVTAPPEWLDRLLGVLLDNACKYSPENGLVEVAVGVSGSEVRLSVDDAGPGIAPEERLRIFDRFHRASERAGGAGLGLAIADAVVQATGGRWIVAVSPAGGARMAVTWQRGMSGPG